MAFPKVIFWFLTIGSEWGHISHRWNDFALLKFVGFSITAQVVIFTLMMGTIYLSLTSLVEFAGSSWKSVCIILRADFVLYDIPLSKTFNLNSGAFYPPFNIGHDLNEIPF